LIKNRAKTRSEGVKNADLDGIFKNAQNRLEGKAV
jgi:hypothetical protein